MTDLDHELDMRAAFWQDESYWARMPTNGITMCAPSRRRTWPKIIFATACIAAALYILWFSLAWAGVE